MSKIVLECRGAFRDFVKRRGTHWRMAWNFLRPVVRPAGPSLLLFDAPERKIKNPQIIAELDFGGSMWESNPPPTSKAGHWI